MVSVLPATVAGTVRTVAAACWLAAGRLLAGGLVAAAAVMLAMMILGVSHRWSVGRNIRGQMTVRLVTPAR